MKPGDKLQKLLMLLVTWGLLLVLFVGYEMYFVHGQEHFLQTNGFRSLASLANQLSAKFAKLRASTESFVRLAHLPDMKPEALDIYLKLYLDSPSVVTKQQDLKNCATVNSENQAHVPLAFVPHEIKLLLSVSCFAKNGEQDTPDPQNRQIPLYIVDIRSWLTDSFHGTSDFDDVLVADETGRVVFESSTSGPRIANLTALLPKSDGSAQPPDGKDGQSTMKDTTSTERSGSAQPKDAGADTTGEGSTKERLSGLETLSSASSVNTITYAGKTYQLFSQPVRIWLPITASSGKVLRLGIYGLLDGERFDDASRRIPYSTLIWAGLIVVALLSLTWPLFKLRYMGATERFGPADGWLLVLAVSLASASVMLMLLNASYTFHAQADVDRRMAKLAIQIKENVRRELKLASNQLEIFRSGVPSPALQSHLVPSYLNANPSNLNYPYFDNAFWLDCSGKQVAKIDARAAPTPTISVSTRLYYRQVISDLKKLARSIELSSRSASNQDICDLDIQIPPTSAYDHLEPVLSVNTDQFITIMSGPFFGSAQEEKDHKITVAALNFRPLSLVDPVLPPGYRFAVLDQDCNVLFHSDSFRNLRENFCQESKDQNELQPWLFAGTDTSIDITYQGHPARAYLTAVDSRPFNGGQTFLLVFREPDVDLTLNLAIVLVCSVLLATYFALWFLIATLYLLLRRPLGMIYPARFFWPQCDHGPRYVQIFAANVVLLILFWLFYPRLYEAPLIGLTLVVAIVAVLLAGFKLISPRRGPLVLSGLLICATVAVWLFLLFDDRESLSEWKLVLVLLALSSLGAAWFAESISSRVADLADSVISRGARFLGTWIPPLVSRPIRDAVQRLSKSLSAPGWLEKSAQRHFELAYILAVLSIIGATVLVPCLGSFKYAYDAISELSLKHDELVLSQRLLERSSRIRQYYDNEVTAPASIVQGRFASPLDRYDTLPDRSHAPERPFFTVQDVPCCDADHSSSAEAQRLQACDFQPSQPSKTINDVLERWMASATLRFPANPLGREMSKLGVASTEYVSSGSQHYWTENDFTHFRLFWTSNSGLCPLTVASDYPDWWGLRWRDRFLLLPLWVALSFWLMMIVNKIFFVDSEDAPFDTVDWKQVADIKKNFLVIERAKSGRTQWMGAVSDLSSDSHLDLRLELKTIINSKTVDIKSTSPILILDYFEYNLRDRKYNLARLELLEKLLLDVSRRLVLVSTVDPLFFLTESALDVLSDSKKPTAAGRLLDRWAEALGKFAKVHPKDSSDREFHKTLESFDRVNEEAGDHPKDCHQFALWVKQECDCTTRLRKIGKDILDQYREKDCKASREWVISRVLDLADSYYHVLWSGLTASERLVLYQLALDGWTNPKNIASIRQLERKLLISRKPMYRIMNESFRRFVLGSEHGEEIAQWEKREQASTWRAFRFVAIAVAVGTGVWLLYTQAAFSQVVVGYIAAIATLLTAVAGLFGRSTSHAGPTK